MKLFWSPRTRAFRVAWMVEELGRPYDRITIDINDEAARADPEFRSASPMGKVPALIDDDARLWDSGAICLYLADAYSEVGLGVPVGNPARGLFLQWTMFTNSVIEPALVEKFAGIDENRPQHGYGSFDQMIDTLEAGLETGPWIVGDGFTAADVLIGSSTHFMQQFGILPDRPALTDYTTRCSDRPAFQRALALDVE